MTWLKFSAGQPKGCRANFALHADMLKAYPKGVAPKSYYRNGTLDGKPQVFAVTSSKVFAAKGDAGNNIWLLINGKPYWCVVEARVDCMTVALDMVSGEGGETKDCKRTPKNPKRELERVKAFKDTYRSRYGSVDRSYSDVNLIDDAPESEIETEDSDAPADSDVK